LYLSNRNKWRAVAITVHSTCDYHTKGKYMRFLIAFLGLALPLLASAADAPAKPKYEEGKHYTVLSGQPKPSKSGKIEVTELFWYGCGHCYVFEPVLHEWEKTLAEDVALVRSPAMWQQRRNPTDAMWTHARLFYTASALGQLDKLHTVFFDAMHKHNKRLVTPEEISAVVSAQGLDGAAFVKTMDSFAVNAQVTQADARQRAYRVTGTPEIVVGGYYHISAGNAGGQKEMLEIADYLIEKIRAER
jgi:thiol:disulfide interchange protein DsbA